MVASAFISSDTRKLLSSVYWHGNKHKELICNHPFVGALVLREEHWPGGHSGRRGLAGMHPLALLGCLVALSHCALASKGECLPLPRGNPILKWEWVKLDKTMGF